MVVRTLLYHTLTCIKYAFVMFKNGGANIVTPYHPAWYSKKFYVLRLTTVRQTYRAPFLRNSGVDATHKEKHSTPKITSIRFCIDILSHSAHT